MDYSVYQLKELLNNYLIPEQVQETSNLVIICMAAVIFFVGLALIQIFIEDGEGSLFLIAGGVLVIAGGFLLWNTFRSTVNTIEAMNSAKKYQIRDVLDLEAVEEELTLVHTLSSAEVLNNIDSTINVLTTEGLRQIYIPKDAIFKEAAEKKIVIEYNKITGIKDSRLPEELMETFKDKRIEVKAKQVFLTDQVQNNVNQNFNINAQEGASVNIDNTVTVE